MGLLGAIRRGLKNLVLAFPTGVINELKVGKCVRILCRRCFGALRPHPTAIFCIEDRIILQFLMHLLMNQMVLNLFCFKASFGNIIHGLRAIKLICVFFFCRPVFVVVLDRGAGQQHLLRRGLLDQALVLNWMNILICHHFVTVIVVGYFGTGSIVAWSVSNVLILLVQAIEHLILLSKIILHFCF